MRISSDNSINVNDAQNNVPSLAEVPGPVRGAGPSAQNQYSMIGKSIQVKGEIVSSDPVYIYGRIEGSIDAEGNRVTVGKEGTVKANVNAREVVIMGDLCGNVDAEYRVEIRGDGSVLGDLATHRLFIEDGAVLRGRIDVSKPSEEQEPNAGEQVQAPVGLGEATSAA